MASHELELVLDTPTAARERAASDEAAAAFRAELGRSRPVSPERRRAAPRGDTPVREAAAPLPAEPVLGHSYVADSAAPLAAAADWVTYASPHFDSRHSLLREMRRQSLQESARQTLHLEMPEEVQGAQAGSAPGSAPANMSSDGADGGGDPAFGGASAQPQQRSSMVVRSAGLGAPRKPLRTSWSRVTVEPVRTPQVRMRSMCPLGRPKSWTEYSLRMEVRPPAARGQPAPEPFAVWTVHTRYRQVRKIHAQLSRLVPGLPPLPPKRRTAKHRLSEQTVDERLVAFQTFFSHALMRCDLQCSSDRCETRRHLDMKKPALAVSDSCVLLGRAALLLRRFLEDHQGTQEEEWEREATAREELEEMEDFKSTETSAEASRGGVVRRILAALRLAPGPAPAPAPAIGTAIPTSHELQLAPMRSSPDDSAQSGQKPPRAEAVRAATKPKGARRKPMTLSKLQNGSKVEGVDGMDSQFAPLAVSARDSGEWEEGDLYDMAVV